MSRRIEVPDYGLQEEVDVDPARTALVVADMQNDFVREGGSLRVPGAEATIPAVSGLIDLARAQGMRIVYSQDTHRDGDPEWRIWPEHAREGSWGWEIVGALRWYNVVIPRDLLGRTCGSPGLARPAAPGAQHDGRAARPRS